MVSYLYSFFLNYTNIWDQKVQNSVFYEAFLPITWIKPSAGVRNTVNVWDHMSHVTSRSLERFGWFACGWLCLLVSFCAVLWELWLRLNEIHEVWTFAFCKAFLFVFVVVVVFSSLENYFGFRTTNVRVKTDHSTSLRWKKTFCGTFPKRPEFFW